MQGTAGADPRARAYALWRILISAALAGPAMRALLAGLLLLAAPAAALPTLGDSDGDELPDTLAWHPGPIAACVPGACASAGAALDALPGQGGLAQPTRHDGFADVALGDCALACAGARLDTFYAQDQGRQPDITLHDFPDFGATGGAGLQAQGARLDLPFQAADTDHNNNTHVSALAPHDAGALEGDAGFTAAVLVLLHHDRGLPHTRLAYIAPFAHECLDAACAALDVNHTYFHHDSDDDVIHEQHRVGFDDTLAAGSEACVMACPPGVVHADGDAGLLLEDSFFIVEPPSGVSGDGATQALAQPPLLATPPAIADASAAFAVRDPDRDLVLDEAFVEACALGQCQRLG